MPLERPGHPGSRCPAPRAVRCPTPGRLPPSGSRIAPRHTPPTPETHQPPPAHRTRPGSGSGRPPRPPRRHAAPGSWPTPNSRTPWANQPGVASQWSSCRPPTETKAPRPWGSLEVLELLPETLQLALHGDHGLGDLGIVRLGAHRVHLAEQFLREESQLLPDRGRTLQRVAARGDVGPEPYQLFHD